MRAIAVATPSSASGGIMRFAKVKAQCLGCRAPLQEAGSGVSLCKHCQPRESEFYARALTTVNELERSFGAHHRA
jgi:DNA polymerase delta subunit 1